MTRSTRSIAAISASLALAGAAAHADPPSQAAVVPTVRDRRNVSIDGKAEVWELQWTSAPVVVCGPDDPGWFTCPCEGFAFGESGDLDLARVAAGKEIDRLHLTPFFSSEYDTPASNTNKAVLRRWPVAEPTADMDAWNDADAADRLAEFEKQVFQREPVSVLGVADFNRDGWASEFVLQIGTLPCGKKVGILIGVSPGQPRLHAFGTAEHPHDPLALYPSEWEKLAKAARPVRVVTWACGDHASEEQTEHVLSVDRAGIHVIEETYACVDGKERGARLSRKAL